MSFTNARRSRLPLGPRRAGAAPRAPSMHRKHLTPSRQISQRTLHGPGKNLAPDLARPHPPRWHPTHRAQPAIPVRTTRAKSPRRFHEAAPRGAANRPKCKKPAAARATGFTICWRRRRDSNPRTRGYRINGFRDRRIQPLCHPSAWGERRAIEEEGAPRESNWRRVRDLNPGDAFGAYTISNRAPSATRTTLRVQHRKLYRIFPTMQTGILCSSYKRGEEGAVTGWWMLDGELIGGSAARGRTDSAGRLARLVQAWVAIRTRYATRHHLA